MKGIVVVGANAIKSNFNEKTSEIRPSSENCYY